MAKKPLTMHDAYLWAGMRWSYPFVKTNKEEGEVLIGYLNSPIGQTFNVCGRGETWEEAIEVVKARRKKELGSVIQTIQI